MKPLAFASLAALGLVAAATARAQTPLTPYVGQPLMPYAAPATSPFYRPPISPYLGLALPGNPALNYYNIVQPQIQTATALGQLQATQLGLASTLGAYGYETGTGLLITGHASNFQNHWGYFQNWRGAGLGVTGLYGGTLAGPRLGLGTVGTGYLRPGTGMVGQQPLLLSAPGTLGIQTVPGTQTAPGTATTPGTQPTPKPATGTPPQ